MKLLSPKELNSKVNAEKKATIDSGVFIARKIDALREEMLELQKNRDLFISGSQQVINDSLVGLQQKKDSLFKEIQELEERRKELLKPLDEAWEKLNKEKVLVTKELNDNYVLREQLKDESQNIEKEKKEITEIASRTRYNEEQTEKKLSSARSLEEMAQRKYEIAEEEYIIQTSTYNKAMAEVNQRREEYENGIYFYNQKEKDLKERESKLSKEQAHFESQKRAFKIAKEVIKNGNA